MPGAVKVELVGPLRAEAGGLKHLDMKIEGRERVSSLLKRLPEGIRARILDEAGRPRPGILIIVNGVEVSSLKPLNEVWVKDGDTVAIIQAIHGGAKPCPP